MRMEINGLSFSYGSGNTVEDIEINVKKGEFVGIIGPNGSGKSTVLKNLYRALTPHTGTAVLDGEDLLKMSYKKSAQKMAVVGQENEVPFDFTVSEIAAMGRTPHKKLFDADTPEDVYMTHHALEHVGMHNMADRDFRELSGGEKQRVIIARAVAQESDFWILDEPTNHLDIGYQMQIFDFIKRLDVTVLAAIHDLNMASLYCDRIYVLKDGKIVHSGTPTEIFTPENIYDVYGVNCTVEIHPITKKPTITFLPKGIN